MGVYPLSRVVKAARHPSARRLQRYDHCFRTRQGGHAALAVRPLPFLRPYRGRIAAAVLFLVLAALTTLAFPMALRKLIDGGLSLPARRRRRTTPEANGARLLALRDHFLRCSASAWRWACSRRCASIR